MKKEDFRPSKRKIITSLVVLIIIIILMSYISAEYTCFSSAPLCTENGCPPYKNPCNMFNPVIIFFMLFLTGIPAFAITYVIYSLFRKKK